MFEIIKYSKQFQIQETEKQGARYFLLIKAVRVASTSISNCCLIFRNVSTSEGGGTTFDFPVILELVQLPVGL